MCGFVVSTDGGNMDKMLDAQRFRGPDHRGETIRYFSTLTWGHVLLDISGTKEVQPYITKKGSILVFDSSVTHAVTKIKSGIRYSLCGWICGPPFS